MPSKRNKLLIFLGLVTVAVSKAHNQRFNSEHGFESKRISASKHSANPSHIDSRSTDGFYDHTSRESDKLKRRSLTSYYDVRTPDVVPNHGRQEQFSKRVGSFQQDSSDLSVDIDPQDFYFEAKKVKTNERKQNSRSDRDIPQEMFFTRRTGMLNADEEKPNTESNKKKTPTETKAKDTEPKVASKTIIGNDKKSKIDSKEPSDDKDTIKKRKPKTKKVLRVRVRGQKGNKTQNIVPKRDSKLISNEKTKDDILFPRSRSSKHIKFPEVKGSAIKDSLKETSTKPTFPESDITSNIPKAKYSKEVRISQVKKESVKDAGKMPTLPKSDTALNEQKPKYSKEVTFAEVKIPAVIKDSATFTERSPMPPQAPQVAEVFHTNKNSASSSKRKTAETGVTKNNDPKENDQVVSFFRRSGKKIADKIEPQPDYPNADWASKYRTENLNKDDDFYVLSFNYMGNKNEPIKDILYIPKVPAPQEKLREAQEVLQAKPPRETGEYPSPQLNIHHLEQKAENFLGNQKKPVKTNIGDSSTYSHSGERDFTPLNENNRGNRYYGKNVESSEDLPLNDRRITEKQLSPKVTLKKKKTKKQKNPVWKLQVQKKNYPDDQWIQSKASPQEAQDNFRTGGEEPSEIFNRNGENYFVRSFIKLPTGDNVDINLKKDDMAQNFHQEQFKAVNTQKKPLFPVENGGGGNYFVHMYKKVGDIENFDFRSGDAPEHKGYMSSLKLSWTDDDTRAQVDEAVDSLAVLPNVEHFHSNERISSREDSNGDEYSQQPSENIMEYKHHDIDDFTSPLNDDKSYFFPDVPITHRLKRSTDTAPRVTTHFKIGESRVESNYTLDQNPVGKFSTQSGTSLNIRGGAVKQPISQVQSPRMSELPDTPVNRQKDTNVKSYYLKPNENKELNPLKMEFKSSDPFNKYENPSRGATNVQIFQSYESPNRDPTQAHDVTYFHNDKNRKIKIHITDRVIPFQTQNSRSNGTDIRNAALNNFKLASSGVIPSSTDIKASYLKPENEEDRNNLLNKTNVNTNIYHVNNTHPQRKSLQSPVLQQRMDETTETPATIALTTNSKKTSEPMKTTSDKRERARTSDFLRTKPTSTSHFNRIANSSTTIVPKRSAAMHIATTVIDRPTIKPTETTVPNRPTVKSTATTVPIRPTAKSTATTVPIRPTVKSTATTVPIKPTVKSTATTIHVRPVVKSTATTAPVKSAVKSTATTVPIRSAIKSTTTTAPIRSAIKSTAATLPIRPATKFTPTTHPNRITTKSFATATSERATKFTTPDVTSEKTTKLKTPAVTSSRTSRPTNTVAQFFHKAEDINAKIDSSPSNIQSRRIDDKSWFYPQRELRNDKHELQAQARQHQESNSEGNNRANEPEVLFRSNEFEHSSNGIDPKVSFQWQDPLNLHIVSEQNYPKYHSIPKTRFTCKKRAPGYYADPETGCQVFHMCQGTGVKHSFLCPNTTIFNQRLLVCDWYSKVTCDSSESFYTGNPDIYRYKPEPENNFKPETNKDWSIPPNQNIATTKYPQPKQENYIQNKNQAAYTNSYKDTKVSDMPQFIVNHFKENIPRAEFGKPKSVTKSYSTVIATPETKIIRTVSDEKHNHHSNEKSNPIFHQKLTSTNEKLIPDTFLEKQRAIYNRWSTKESERTLNHELSAPEPHKDHHGKHLPYSTSNQDTLNHEDKNYHLPEKSKVNNGNSYYVPNIRDANRYENEEDDEIHFAGRQNDKVIIVNRNRLYPEYQHTESPGLQQPEKRVPGESLTKFTHSVPTKVTTKTPHRDFQGTKILNPEITPQTHSNFQSQTAYKINNGGTSYQEPKHNMYNSKEGRNQKQSYNGPRNPQYIYPLPGIVQNNDGTREFNYGYRVEDPKSINLPNPEILSRTSPRSNNNILMNPERETSKSNKNILIKPETITPRFNKNILTKSQNQNPRFNKNIHVGPNSETPMFNKNTHIRPNNETPRFNKNIHVGSNSETPMFNKNIHTETNSETPRFNKNNLIGPNNKTPMFTKNIHIGPNKETPRFNKNIHVVPNSETSIFEKNIHVEPNSETPRFNKNIPVGPNSETPRFNGHIRLEPIKKTPRFNKNILIETGDENPVFNKNVVIKPDPRFKDDPEAGKIKWRIAEIKSGIESIGAQVGKILDENAFQNVRIFKLKPESSSGELEEIKFIPFKSERQPSIPQNSKTKEEKREKLSLSAIKSDPNNRENTNPAFKPNVRAQPINGGKRYEGRSNFRPYATENAGANYNTPLTMLPVQKFAEQVTRDIVPKHKEVSNFPPKTANHETPRSYDQTVKVMPHNVRTKNWSIKREIVPVGTHESVNINQYKQLTETSGSSDYDAEIKIPSKLGVKETPEKKYEVKYIPLIKIEKTTEPKEENKKLIPEEEIIKPVPLYINQKSEHFDHVIVPKKIQGNYQPKFHYPKKIIVQENSGSSEIRSIDLADLKPTGIGMNEKYEFDNTDKSEIRKSGDLPINNPQTKSLNTDRQVYDTSGPEAQKKEVRTFVVITKPVPAAEKHSNFKSNNAHYDNHKTILTPIQTKFQNMNANVDPSLDCDDSSTSSQNPFNTLTLQLGKNGPSQEFMKYIPLTKPSNNQRGTNNVRIYYNSGDESSSKCRNKDDSKSKNQDISTPESDEKILDKKLFFNKKPFPKVTFKKELKRPKFAFSPDKTPVKFNAKTLEENEQKMVSPKMKPLKLFELQRNSRPAFTKPSQKPTTPTIPESKIYFFPTTKTEEGKASDESEDDSDRKSMERSKRVASVKKAKYADLEKAAELKTGIHNNENEKKAEAVHFSAARKGPQNETVGKSEDSNESSSSHSRQSRYADIEKAAELEAERMLRSKSRST